MNKTKLSAIRSGQLAVLVSLFVAAGPTHATVVPIAWYKLGEADPGASANAAGQATTQDSSANNLDATRTGTPIYRADTAFLSAGSTLSMEFNGTSDLYARATPVTVATTGVGIEAWAKPDAASAPAIAGYVAYNGAAGTDGYGFFQAGNGLSGVLPSLLDNHWYGLVSTNFVDLGAVVAGQWIHLGMTFDNITGNTSIYTNGVLAATAGPALTPGSVNPPNARFEIGAYAPTGVQYFDGKIDQVRVFTFAGAFNPNDFLIGAIPEPSTALLLLLGGSLVWKRVRRTELL